MSDPIFTLTPTNSFGLRNVGSFASSTLIDIDGDRDLDVFVGKGDGNTAFFRNTGTVNSPIFAAPSTNPFGLSDVGALASPTFVDIDGDKDLDAFIGDGYFGGNTLFFRNTGTASNPVFAAPAINPFGLVGLGYYASPIFADIDGDGDLDALLGEGSGNTVFQRNIGSKSTPIFAAASFNSLGLIDVGYSAEPTFVDIDGDGDQDAFIGNGSGDVMFFRNTGTANNPFFATPSPIHLI